MTTSCLPAFFWPWIWTLSVIRIIWSSFRIEIRDSITPKRSLTRPFAAKSMPRRIRSGSIGSISVKAGTDTALTRKCAGTTTLSSGHRRRAIQPCRAFPPWYLAAPDGRFSKPRFILILNPHIQIFSESRDKDGSKRISTHGFLCPQPLATIFHLNPRCALTRPTGFIALRPVEAATPIKCFSERCMMSVSTSPATYTAFSMSALKRTSRSKHTVLSIPLLKKI